MFKNYFKISIRNLLRHKTFAFINIFGLALGMTCCMIISKYLISEIGYDTYHLNRDRLYRITIETEQLSSGESWKGALSPILWGPALQRDYTEVQNYTRLMKSWKPLHFELNENRIKQDNIYFAENSLFDLFNWDLIQGDVEKVFDHPYAIVLTEQAAKKYFRDENPLGKNIMLVLKDRNEQGQMKEKKVEMTVSGVMADVHPKTHIKPEVLVSFITLNDFYGGDINAGSHPNQHFWRYTIAYTYLLLQKDYYPQELEQKFPQFIDKYIGDANVSRGFRYKPYLQKVSGIHLEKNVYSTPEPGGNKDHLYLFSIISFLILLIACFNFMNLTTARSCNRSIEVGIRKVVGSQKRDLITQFMCESVIISMIALILALVLSELFSPVFSHYTGHDISLLPQEILPFVLSLFAITVFVGIFAGSYPAFFLSAFKPVTVIRKTFQSGSKGAAVRKALVILQFVITVFFIIATLTVKEQINFMKTQDLGFNSSEILVIPPTSNSPLITQMEVFRNELLGNPNIKNISISSEVPGNMYRQDVWKEYGQQEKEITVIYEIEIDYDFIKMYELNLVAGRNFSKDMATDAVRNLPKETGTITSAGLASIVEGGTGKHQRPKKVAVILNEEAVRRLDFGSPEEALGKILVRDPVSVDFTGEVIGVFRDFHFQSLKSAIEPLVLYLHDTSASHSFAVSIRIYNHDITSTVSFIEKLWNTHFPESTFEYFFIDENFAQLYEQEEKILEIFSYMTSFTIFIACLGLFGLILYMTEQKTKEIGIRKVLGASVPNIVRLLTKEFTKWVILANIIAWPIAWYAMNKWLQNFAYRINIGLWTFLLAGALVQVIALLTVSYQAIKAATANPVEALRYE